MHTKQTDENMLSIGLFRMHKKCKLWIYGLEINCKF